MADKQLPSRSSLASPLPLPIAPPHNLPAYGSSFIGREREVADVSATLAQERLVTLLGTGGMGKTRLALRVAEAAAATFVDGVWFVDVSSLGDGDQVAAAVAAAIRTRGAGRRRRNLMEELVDRRLLLVLDGCERVRASSAALVHEVLRRCPNVSVLATGRQALGVPGEYIVWVEPLPFDPEAGTSAAARLFVERARAARPAYQIPAEELPSVDEICRALDGLPLALELAAARTAVLSPREIVEQLAIDPLSLLTDGGPLASIHHQSLRASLEWSHQLLGPREAALFARLGVFAGGWDLQAAAQVCAGGDVKRADVLNLLAALVAKTLVAVDGSLHVTRYRMLESVRCFALQRLEGAGDRDRFAAAHAEWCMERANAAARERGGREPEKWLDELEDNHANFRAALAWARDNERVDIALALGTALSWFWETRGHLAEGLEWLTWALDHDTGPDIELRARALRTTGIFRWLQGDVGAAIPLVEESVALFRDAGNDHEATGCVCASMFHVSADASHSLQDLESDLATLRDSGDPARFSRALVNCGVAYFFVSDAVRARRCFQECLELPREDVDAEVVVDALDGIGRVAVQTGDLRAADSAFTQALAMARRIEYDDGCCTAASWLGEIRRVRGEYDRARPLIDEAAQLAVDSGVPLWHARCLQFLGRLEAAEGNLEEASRLFQASLDAPGAAHMPYHKLRSLQGLADIALAGGDDEEVRTLADEALHLATENGDIQARGQFLALLARLSGTEGDAGRASKLAHEALQLQERIGDVIGIVSTLETLAELAAANGRSAVAARLFGAAQQARETCGCRRPRVEEAALLRHLPTVAALIDQGEWTAAVTQGSALSPAEAVAYATRGRGAKGRPTFGWDSLTRVELEVAGLVAIGLSNPEIAEKLMLSVKTVATHLTHIYRKVPCSDRRELRRLARDRAQPAPGAD